MQRLLVIFIHGYSVSSIDTYGQLPQRLQAAAHGRGYTLEVADLYLARYISFNDQVRLDDLAVALEMALKDEIYRRYPGERFICITHSTGGPLVRTWLDLHYPGGNGCPLSHLVMLAPANHGSSLAQLGKSKAGRLRAWFNGQEPGQRVLDWLELGSRGAWRLNKKELRAGPGPSANNVFYFVITGQDIDRKLYDHINSYTGEPGSDGVVRVASANLNDNWVKLVQDIPGKSSDSSLFRIADNKSADHIPFRIVRQRSHSGADMGIMRSVTADEADRGSSETVDVIFRCFGVSSRRAYIKLAKDFAAETAEVQRTSLIETEKKLIGTRFYLHDRHSMVIFRVRDSDGRPVKDFDLLLTAGETNDADNLPTGFFRDRQFNKKDGATLTYYVNYDMMAGCPAATDASGNVIRPAQPGVRSLGIKVFPRPDSGLVRFMPAMLPASEKHMFALLKPNATTMVEIVLRRLVSTEVMRIENIGTATKEWDDTEAGDRFIG